MTTAPIRVMLDTETLSTDVPYAIVFQLGAVVLGSFDQPLFKYTVNPQKILLDQGWINQGIDVDTVKWHQTENQENWQKACQAPWENTHEQMVNDFVKFIQEVIDLEGGNYEIWCRGTDFDIPILKNLFKSQSTPIPWKYNKVRDLRTIIAWHGDPGFPKPEDAHDALADAIYQARQLEDLLRYRDSQ